jgi:DNA-binding response OmpR family regulator
MTTPHLLKGRNILVVEDEMMVAMMLEDILQEAGCNVICVGHLEQATLLARERDLDAAVLDENLHGQRSYPVADALVARRVPFVFATGYGETNLREIYPGRPVIAKPYRDTDVLAALAVLISAAAASGAI